MGKNKYIFVTGGVLSGVGKGITAASIGALLQAKGCSVSIQKCDPYLNVDAGLLNPAEHGECFVTKDGAETDLDLGHYERFLDIELTQNNATLAGKLLTQLIADERSGKFGGKTVQLVPHLTGAIQDAIQIAANGDDVHIVEIGGTVGDYEGLSFIEAIREFAYRVGKQNCMYVHVVYVPFISTSKEFKTKPAQNALNDLRGFGIMPDVIVVRSDDFAPKSTISKIALFSGLPEDAILLMPNVKSVYEVPLKIADSPVLNVLEKFIGKKQKIDLSRWKDLVKKQQAHKKHKAKIGLIAKYMDNEDTYISVLEAIKSASWSQNTEAEIIWIDASKYREKDLKNLDAIIVPGGFGSRGIEGKILAADYAYKKDIPYLGLCLGLQVAVIASARRAGLKDANSTEFDLKTTSPVVYIMDGQEGKQSTGGTLRLGDYQATLTANSLAKKLYKDEKITERHRHRYEVNQEFLPYIQKGGLIVSGTSPDKKLVEFVEAPNKKFYIATQAHPEFKSRPNRPHPLFVGLIRAVLNK